MACPTGPAVVNRAIALRRLDPSGFHPSRRRASPATPNLMTAPESLESARTVCPSKRRLWAKWYGVYELMAGLGRAAKCVQLIVSNGLKPMLS